MYDEKLKVAYEKSNEIIKLLSYDDNDMISTQDVINIVEKHYCPSIIVQSTSFSKIGISEGYGAMMSTVLDDTGCKPIKATIVLNSDNDEKFQRFSLMHEIGHLITRAWDKEDIQRTDANTQFIVSTHIDYNITNIPEKLYKNSVYLTNEQIANIFALRVLMPSEQFFEKMKQKKISLEVAKFFGLTEDAVISRMMIGA